MSQGVSASMNRPRRHGMFLPFSLCVFSSLGLSGCSNAPTPAAKPEAAATTATETAQPAATAPVQPPTAVVTNSPPIPKPDWSAKLTSVEQAFAQQDLAATEQGIEELLGPTAVLSDDDKTRLTKLQEQFETARDQHANELRQQQLTTAQASIANGKLDQAAELLETVLTSAPTNEQGDLARELQSKIEQHRQVRRKLRTGMDLLAQPGRARAREAQEILWDEQEVAIPLLLEALESKNADLVTNTLEVLRKFNQPQRSLPAMVAILGRAEQASLWPIAIREIQKVSPGGAGDPLLKLALSSQSPEAAIPALTALSGISDPPRETLIKLLPRVYQSQADLAATLAAIFQAVSVHSQTDLATRRGLDLELTPQEEQQLDALPERLAQLISAAPAVAPIEKSEAAAVDPAAEIAWQAKRLAIALRQLSASPLEGVKVVRATSELPESPATAALDGIWNSVDPKTMWRHPARKLTTLVLDLGTERTVTGVRIWNCNESSGAHRGWKDVEIYVSNEPSPVVPAATGMIPTAPGTAETPDYGAILPVPFAKGRYLKLQLMNLHREDGWGGLSEVQILGF